MKRRSSLHGVPRPRSGAADIDTQLAAYLAVRWTVLGRPGSSAKAADGVAQEYFGARGVSDLTGDQIDTLLAAQAALETHRLLPPIDRRLQPAARVNHSIMLRDAKTPQDVWRVLDAVLYDGLWPQPVTTGKYSENPHVVFFVADAPAGGREDRRYSSDATWITADLPFEVYTDPRVAEYRGKYLINTLRNLTKLRPGSVGAVTGIPPEFIVGVNGCPVDLFDDAVGRWGRW
jgi:hypothetical protein